MDELERLEQAKLNWQKFRTIDPDNVYVHDSWGGEDLPMTELVRDVMALIKESNERRQHRIERIATSNPMIQVRIKHKR